MPRKARFNPTFCKRINRTSNSSRDCRQVLKKGTNDLYRATKFIYNNNNKQGFTPNGINNECVSNSSKKSSQGVR